MTAEILQTIAFLCAIHTGSPLDAEKLQIKCQAYYASCFKQMSGETYPEDFILDCMIAREKK